MSKTASKVTITELFDVLSFYSEANNYTSRNKYSYPIVFKDRGKKARKILKRLVNEYLEDFNKKQ